MARTKQCANKSEEQLKAYNFERDFMAKQIWNKSPEELKAEWHTHSKREQRTLISFLSEHKSISKKEARKLLGVA